MISYVLKAVVVSFISLTNFLFILWTVVSQLMEEQHKGMCSVPKLAMNVMACEVVRLLQLTKSSVVPLSYCVPRKVIKPSCFDHPSDCV